jgi:hypothetical protein
LVLLAVIRPPSARHESSLLGEDARRRPAQDRARCAQCSS